MTGASAEYLLAMKLEAGRDKDIEDIAYLLERLRIKKCDGALAVHEAILPDTKRRSQARALLSALARETPGLEPPTNNTEKEQAWLAALEGEEFPRYEYETTPKRLTLTVQTTQEGPRQVLGEGLTVQGLALMECGHRGWPEEAVDVIKGFAAAELTRQRQITRLTNTTPLSRSTPGAAAGAPQRARTAGTRIAQS